MGDARNGHGVASELRAWPHEGSTRQVRLASSHCSNRNDAWASFPRCREDDDSGPRDDVVAGDDGANETIEWYDRQREAFSCCWSSCV